MKATIHVEGNTPADLATGLRAHLAIYEAASGKTAATQVAATATAKAGKSTKPAPKAEETEEDEDFDLAGADDEEETEEEADDADAEEETEEEADDEEAVSLDDALSAANKYTKKHSREAVAKILKKKFGVKGVRDLKPAQFAGFIAALK